MHTLGNVQRTRLEAGRHLAAWPGAVVARTRGAHNHAQPLLS